MRGKSKSEQGLTLVELIVVLAIVAALSALAIPGLARLGAFSNDSLPRASRELFEMLSAARIYATTWNVRTAVVYNLDNYQSPTVNPTNDPVPGTNFTVDSVTNQQVRYISAASMMYALPNSEGRYGDAIVAAGSAAGLVNKREDAFVPAAGKEWQWKLFDDEIVLLLMDPISGTKLYDDFSPRYRCSADNMLGLAEVGLYPGLPVILDFESLDNAARNGESATTQGQYVSHFVAHVFSPDGQLVHDASAFRCANQNVRVKERYTFYMGYRPDEPFDRRLTNAEYPAFQYLDPESNELIDNLRVVPVELYRSTGRVKIAS